MLAMAAAMDDERPVNPAYEGGQDIRDRSFEFACRAVVYAQRLYDRGGAARVMAPQIIDASTSLPAMLEEARAAESRRDFVSKCSIGLKEAREAWVRLRISAKVETTGRSEADALIREAREIIDILGAIIRNTRRNAGLELDASRKRTRIVNSKL
jgi:four helix bundle protein